MADNPDKSWDDQGWFSEEYHPGYDTRGEYLDQVLDDWLDEFEFSPYE